MPPGAATKLTSAQKTTIRDWIDQGAQQDLNLSLSGMDPHVGQLTELRIVWRHTGALIGRAILDPLPAAAFSVFLPVAVLPGEFDLNFFSDLNGNRAYDAPPVDHAWSVPIPSTGQVAFAHNTTFTDIGATAASEPGGSFTLNFTGMTPHVNQLLEVRVIKVADGQTVGAYRLAVIPGAAFGVSIPGIIENGQEYRVDFFADLNGNGAYDAPPTDHAWRLTGTGGGSGLTLGFAHNTDFTDIKL
jgi:hypothetical protein